MTVGEWQLERQRLEHSGSNYCKITYGVNRLCRCNARHYICRAYARYLFRYLDCRWWYCGNAYGITTMSDFIWCHGPNCHKYHTTDRIRGCKGSKTLRTRKVKQRINSMWYDPNNAFNYFCSQGCLMCFMKTHIHRIVALDPRNSPLNTLINDPTKNEYGWTKITERGVDTAE